MLTLDQLSAIMPLLPSDKAWEYLPLINGSMDGAQINTKLRMAAFLAQIAHESYQLKYMMEEWGPTETQKRYDPPDELAAKLGNTEVGDGFKYRGAGPIQCTGKNNFGVYGLMLGLDLVNHPELAATPEVGFKLACAYWTKHGLNQFADTQDFITITKRINGGLNGLAQRQAFYNKALLVLT